ncbi:tRNA-specific adenosine deaminase [Gordonia spumicola]|uniref:tRNA-specific adenosine deaminase n=1 Tax=Gordonia spumicola TaxID=589161 RepID=A0A7I9V2Y3_9ACTN|nr:nucleoside deaminase [Gordonia spumicola]GED99764.1 tRNA-specific adenosine deaminase [Gordonia spumicola]
MTLTPTDHAHLRRCVELAREAVEAGDEAFGSLLVDADDQVVFEDRNRVSGGDSTRHPELTIVEWAVQNMTPDQRAASVTYTSGEHCAMCSAAHAWVGLGRIVYAGSTAQLTRWRSEWGLPESPVAPLSIADVAPGVDAFGPVPEFTDELRALHARSAGVTP